MGFDKVLQPNIIATASSSYSGSSIDVSMPSASFAGHNKWKRTERTHVEHMTKMYIMVLTSLRADSKQYLAPLPTSAVAGNKLL